MAFNPGGTYRPEQRNFVIALVTAIRENKKASGVSTAPAPKKKKGK